MGLPLDNAHQYWAYCYQLLTEIDIEKFLIYNTGSRSVALISNVIIKYGRTMGCCYPERRAEEFVEDRAWALFLVLFYTLGNVSTETFSPSYVSSTMGEKLQ